MRYASLEDAFAPLSTSPVPRYAVPDEFYLPSHMRSENFEDADISYDTSSKPSLLEFVVVSILVLMIADMFEFGR